MDYNDNNYGEIKIADDVVAITSSIATSEIEGIAGMSGGIAEGFNQILGKNNLTKGVKVNINENEVEIDLYVIVEYGIKIPDVAWKVQENVKQNVESTTGLKVMSVNIHVQGVNFNKDTKNEINNLSNKKEEDTE